MLYVRLLSVAAAVGITILLLLGAQTLGIVGERFFALNYLRWWWVPLCNAVWMLSVWVGMSAYWRRKRSGARGVQT
jgi:hypothetical protein